MNFRALLVASLVLALTLVGFGHTAVSPSDQAQADSYILAGGSWADLCADGDGVDETDPCTACLIAKTTLAASPLTAPIRLQPGGTRIATLYSDLTYSPTSARAQPARAPPFA